MAEQQPPLQPTPLTFTDQNAFLGHIRSRPPDVQPPIIVTCAINFQRQAWQGNVNFSNVTFNEGVDFSGATFNGIADFREAIFRGIAIFLGTIFEKDVNFHRVAFNDIAIFRETKFKGIADFSSAIFNGTANFSGATFEPNALFSSAIFKGVANFFKAAFQSDGYFTGATFKGVADYREAKFKGIAYFSSAIFTGNVSFLYATFTEAVDFPYATFTQKVDFSYATFKNAARFYSAQFNAATKFENTRFEGLIDFWSATFAQAVIFYKTDFLQAAVFSQVHFMQNVLFTFSSLEGNMIFRHAKIDKGIDLALAASIKGDINFFDTEIKNYQSTSGAVNTDDGRNTKIPTKNKRETFRIIKANYLMRHNGIEAVYFHQLEMEAYKQELQEAWSPKKKDNTEGAKANVSTVGAEKKKSKFKIAGNFVILYLNSWSNAHGSSWGRGVLFTLGVGMVFFIACLLCIFGFHLSWAPDWFVTNYLQFLVPLRYTPIFAGYHLSALYHLFDMLGRIFVSYGIYQTISAFRKFNKRG